MQLHEADPLVWRHQENIQHGTLMQVVTTAVIIQRNKLQAVALIKHKAFSGQWNKWSSAKHMVPYFCFDLIARQQSHKINLHLSCSSSQWFCIWVCQDSLQFSSHLAVPARHLHILQLLVPCLCNHCGSDCYIKLITQQFHYATF